MTGVEMGESLGFGCDGEEEGRWLVRGQQWWMIERRLGQGQHVEEKTQQKKLVKHKNSRGERFVCLCLKNMRK